MTRILVLILTTLMLTLPWFSEADEPGQPVDFTLQRLHGEALTRSEFRQKWVVLKYWATWCAPCRKEIPELSELSEAREDIVVLGLAYEDTEIENFDEFLKEFNPLYPLLLVDVYAPPEPFGAPKVLPTTIILNPQGYPVKTFLGPVTREAIEAYVDSH